MDIGIQMGWEVLEDKLEERENPRRCEVTWNLIRLPKLDDPGTNRLFVSVGGDWQGYFVLKTEILWNPEDSRCPYALIFDTRTWTEIRPVKTRRFRVYGELPDRGRRQPLEALWRSGGARDALGCRAPASRGLTITGPSRAPKAPSTPPPLPPDPRFP